MILEIIVLLALAAVAGFAAAPLLLRRSSIEEMRLLIQHGGSAELLSSAWAEDDFPEFFSESWGQGGRESYVALARSLRGGKYGRSRELLSRLIRIEDERQSAKSGAAAPGADERFRQRMLAMLEGYRGMDGFESVLAAFLERRYTERKDGARS